MKYHVYDQKTKKQIVKRYLQGERVVTLTRELWPKCKTNNHRRTIYLWIYKYTTKKEINTWEKKYKFKISKVVYDLNMKKTILKRHFWGESVLSLCKEIWPNKDPYISSSIIRGWKKQLISFNDDYKKMYHIYLAKKGKKKINYENLSKEELVEILKIYDKYHEIVKDDSKKKNKLKTIDQCRVWSFLSLKFIC